MKKRIRSGYLWACDNGAYTGKFVEERWLRFLKMMSPYRENCLFVVAPDVVADATATLALYSKYENAIRQFGYKVAFVAQDGQERLPFPQDFNVLFVGGTTEWKMGQGALDCIKRAKALGKWVHIGRVNTRKRFRAFQVVGADSADGTGILFNPRREYRRIMGWVHQPELLVI